MGMDSPPVFSFVVLRRKMSQEQNASRQKRELGFFSVVAFSYPVGYCSFILNKEGLSLGVLSPLCGGVGGYGSLPSLLI